MSEELKPCPFCGGEAELQEPMDFDDIRGAVMCMSCFATLEKDNWKDAETAWNNRPNESQLLDAHKRMTGVCTEMIKENRKLREALKPFAECAGELEGSEDTDRTPDNEWAKFRLLASDYRRAKAALGEG